MALPVSASSVECHLLSLRDIDRSATDECESVSLFNLSALIVWNRVKNRGRRESKESVKLESLLSVGAHLKSQFTYPVMKWKNNLVFSEILRCEEELWNAFTQGSVSTKHWTHGGLRWLSSLFTVYVYCRYVCSCKRLSVLTIFGTNNNPKLMILEVPNLHKEDV